MYTQCRDIGRTDSLFAGAARILTCLMLVAMVADGAVAGDLSFAWSAVSYSGDPLVYEVHYGEASRGYNDHVAATDTTATVGELQGDHTYYFAVRACTEDRDLCSGFSNELSSTIPGAPVVNFTADRVSGKAPLKVNFTGSAIGAYILAGPETGIIKCTVDGEHTREIDTLHYHSGFNYPMTVMFLNELPGGEHTLELEILENRPGRMKTGGTAFRAISFVAN